MAGVSPPIKLTGLYQLTDDGRLGVIGDDNAIALDAALTEAFQAHNQRFLADYLAAPDDGLRLAIVFRTHAPKAWGNDTLWLEENVVRDLYPIAGRGGGALTTFQQKNREKSLYRGFELLLDYRKESSPKAPIYCPVLFDRGTTLAQYDPTATDGSARVVEVLNLVGTIPIGRRDVAAVHALMQKVGERLIRKDLRRSAFAIAERTLPTTAPVEQGAYEADRRAERQVSFNHVTAAHVGGVGRSASQTAQSAGAPKTMTRWLSQPQGKPDVALLRSFAVLCDLSADVLEILAGQLSIHMAPSGVQLLHRDTSDDSNMYLIEGNVALEPADGTRLFIEGGTDKARVPVASLKPRKYTVTTLTPVRFLWIPDSLLALARASAPAFSAKR